MQFTVSPEVQQFVRTHIRTLEQLEVLLLVSALPQREWTAKAVYRVVLSTPELVQQRLDGFVQAGILTQHEGSPPTYRYAPRCDELARQISALASAFQLGRHKIVEIIYPPSNRDPVKDFSDAFKLRPDEET